mmetsp:Transcript_17103/g.25450  ORF Transcript_17103/g.25450 Transcript_17103/m.25450 type:complete len:96 (-) Transcript_17103:325-612(-)
MRAHPQARHGKNEDSAAGTSVPGLTLAHLCNTFTDGSTATAKELRSDDKAMSDKFRQQCFSIALGDSLRLESGGNMCIDRICPAVPSNRHSLSTE